MYVLSQFAPDSFETSHLRLSLPAPPLPFPPSLPGGSVSPQPSRPVTSISNHVGSFGPATCPNGKPNSKRHWPRQISKMFSPMMTRRRIMISGPVTAASSALFMHGSNLRENVVQETNHVLPSNELQSSRHCRNIVSIHVSVLCWIAAWEEEVVPPRNLHVVLHPVRLHTR